jgi:hypothetical protein
MGEHGGGRNTGFGESLPCTGLGKKLAPTVVNTAARVAAGDGCNSDAGSPGASPSRLVRPGISRCF